MKIQSDTLLFLLRLGVTNCGLCHRNITVCQTYISACSVLHGFRCLGGFNGGNTALNELLSAFIDALGIGIVRFGLFDTGRCFLQIGLGLFDRGVCSTELGLLLSVVEASQNSTLRDAVADIGSKIDQYARYLEAYL